MITPDLLCLLALPPASTLFLAAPSASADLSLMSITSCGRRLLGLPSLLSEGKYK